MYSTVHGDIWALGCILAEMIASVRPWEKASLEDRNYRAYRDITIKDRDILLEVLPLSSPARHLLLKIFSTEPEHRPSLAAIRMEVLAVDTFFMSKQKAAESGWTERLERMMVRKIHARGQNADAFRRSLENRYTSCAVLSSSESRYSCGSSSSAFESSSAEWSDVPLTPPALAVEDVEMGKESSRPELPPLRIVAASQNF
jgi:serine/threonine protein kinase